MVKKICEVVLMAFIGFSFTTIKNEEINNVIYIDPGHGGMDGGCQYGDLLEKDLNLSISILIRTQLENLGYIVKMTRNGDYDLASPNATNRKHEDIVKRCELMNEASLFVSIHTNKFSQESVRGAQVFYYGEKNKCFSEIMQKSLCDILKNTDRSVKSLNDIYLLINTKTIGCLVEIGFISNNNERKILQTKEYQEKLAYAITLGIISYLEDKKENV